MLEKDIEDVLVEHSELIEGGLVFQGRQVRVGRKFVDLLFMDKQGRQLLVELKREVAKRSDVAQLIDYAGYFIKPDKPPIRLMLAAPRIPQNFKTAFEYCRIEYRELSIPTLEAFWKPEGFLNEQEKLSYQVSVNQRPVKPEGPDQIKNIVRQATARRVRLGKSTERERFAIELLSISDKPVTMAQIKEFMTKKGIFQKSYFDIFNGLCDAGIAEAVKSDGLKAYFMREAS